MGMMEGLTYNEVVSRLAKWETSSFKHYSQGNRLCLRGMYMFVADLFDVDMVQVKRDVLAARGFLKENEDEAVRD